MVSVASENGDRATEVSGSPEYDPERLEALSRGLKSVWEQIDELDATIATKEERIDELERRVDELEEQLAEQLDLQRHLTDATRLTVDQRASVLIQTLVNEARARERRGEPPLAEMDYNAALKALGGSLDRRQIYDTFDRADRLVDGDAIRYRNERRSAQKNSRLIADLESGDLPSSVESEGIDRGRR